MSPLVAKVSILMVPPLPLVDEVLIVSTVMMGTLSLVFPCDRRVTEPPPSAKEVSMLPTII